MLWWHSLHSGGTACTEVAQPAQWWRSLHSGGAACTVVAQPAQSQELADCFQGCVSPKSSTQ